MDGGTRGGGGDAPFPRQLRRGARVCSGSSGLAQTAAGAGELPWQCEEHGRVLLLSLGGETGKRARETTAMMSNDD
jgi:hypothetical protein